MLKSIQLKFSEIKYSGDSVGDDIRIEIEILDQFLRVDQRIKPGSAFKIDQSIGQFTTDQKLFKADVQITAIEKDLLFNDISKINGTLKIDTISAKSQKFIFKIQIQETRWGKAWGEQTARFEITLEAVVSDAIKYTPDVGEGTGKGWLMVKFENGEPDESIPAYIKLTVERIDTKREYFTILEGAYRDKSASVEIGDDGSSWLIAGIKHELAALIIYSISKKVLTLKGKKYKADDDPRNPWKKGFYDIEIPDHPHEGGLKYPEAGRGTVWFRIGHSGNRYLHPGRVSAGCISITETARWMEIYNALIKARKGDFMSVGVLEVID